jgi:prevent-host-death family protein
VRSVNLADAKAHLSKLVEEAAAGEPVCITRRGRPVALLTAVEAQRRRIDPSALQVLTEVMPTQSESAGNFVRQMREDDRY